MGVPVTAILGLGREVGDAIARRFSETGHRVLAADPSAERLATARNAVPDDVIFHHGELFTRLGLDNAVIIPELEEPDTLLDFSTEKFDKAIAKSIRGTALALQVFAERIAEQEDLPTVGVERLRQKGTITFVLSYSAIASMPGQFTETISQGGVLGVMRAGAVELADLSIRVNAIVAVRPSEERIQSWTMRRTPLGRTALADEIADACRFMASPEAAFITGEALRLDGGRRGLAGLLD
jgi:NAD(P)-dependent dehydrogenase (short-subunit alcohol dehydrogenase family)